MRIRPLSAAERAIAGALTGCLKHGGIKDVPMATVMNSMVDSWTNLCTGGDLRGHSRQARLRDRRWRTMLVVGPPGGGKTHALLGDSCSSAPATHRYCSLYCFCMARRFAGKRLTARLTMSFVDVSRASEGEGLVVHELPAMLGGAEPFVACEIDDVLEVEVSSAEAGHSRTAPPPASVHGDVREQPPPSSHCAASSSCSGTERNRSFSSTTNRAMSTRSQ